MKRLLYILAFFTSWLFARGAEPRDTIPAEAVSDPVDSAWYNRGVDAVKGWLKEDFPTVYCDTAYSSHDYTLVIRATLARDKRIRVKTTVSGDSAAFLSGPIVRFIPPAQKSGFALPSNNQ